MIRSIRRFAVAVAATFVLALPVSAQDDVSTVSFDGFGFAFDAALGSSVAIQQIGTAPAEGPSPPTVAHHAFSVADRTTLGFVVPGAFRAPGVVSVFAVADLEAEPTAVPQLEQLRGILADRPDLADYTHVIPASEHNPLPALPIIDASQQLRARATYVDTAQLAGIAYIAGYSQDIARFSSGDFIWTFQGISTDGAWYVSVVWEVVAPGFPRVARTPDDEDQGANHANYLNRAIAKLNVADAAAFAPPLASLDALVQSITFEGVPAGEPEPLPSPSASPA